jgi:hypothetical protein
MNPFTEKAAVRLKAENPLVADEDNVVRQRSTVHRPKSSSTTIEKEHYRDVRFLTKRVRSQSLLKLDARRRKNIGGRKAGFARSQCPEKHPGTQGCLRQEAILSLFVDTDKFRLCETNKKHRERALSRVRSLTRRARF